VGAGVFTLPHPAASKANSNIFFMATPSRKVGLKPRLKASD